MASHLNDVMVLQKCIVVNRDGQILAIRRTTNDHHRSGCWDLPGGGYEQGEDVVDAVRREVMEEVGLKVGEVTPIYIASGIDDSSEFMNGHFVFANCYYTRDWSGQVTLSDEHIEYQWIDPKEFIKLDFGSDGGFFVSAITKYLRTLGEKGS